MSLRRLRERVMRLRTEVIDEPSRELLDILDGIIAEIGSTKEDIDMILDLLEKMIEETIENREVVIR
ncbi:hypothetical protein [Candidatus Aciduliprofundum boonei]|uniref:Uncharacterized protein n=1 Tax=Aciduliprofundum boonei (strain DSM 19572 / T469) TaxID=439481 RepID=D3T9N5_ACIB4|nr:hypothetical protein [Candidatus Aciduliprofundum boonei]ADD08814.1 conserved hypothetical protein [Aciduliprofundum boonei T469]HII55413.1 hypothetical protein [Candidatus Aciduliprofundum boonei]